MSHSLDNYDGDILRPDLQVVADLIDREARVLDLGCDKGDLLAHLIEHKQIRGRGIELSEAGVLACVQRGLSVRQSNLQEGLADYPDGSFDYVILSQTLPYLDDPAMIIEEMLRVGTRAIVSFPNWGHWRCRLELLLTGCIPKVPDLPQEWFISPRQQAFSITDFSHFCDQIHVWISRQVYITNGRIANIRRFKTLLASTAIFILERPQ